MEVTEHKRKTMILRLPAYKNLTEEQQEREDQFFSLMYNKGYLIKTHTVELWAKVDTVTLYKVD